MKGVVQWGPMSLFGSNTGKTPKAIHRRDCLNRRLVDGTDKRILAPDLYAGASSWSPDGKWIAFYAHDGKSMERSWGVYVVSAEGGEPIWLGKGTTYAPPAWLPDSTHLLIPHNRDIFMVGLEGERKRLANWTLSEFNIIDILLRPTPSTPAASDP